jgi:hypothetical protein
MAAMGMKGMSSLSSVFPLMSEDLEGHFPSSLLDNMETSLNGLGLLNAGGSFENSLLQQLLPSHMHQLVAQHQQNLQGGGSMDGISLEGQLPGDGSGGSMGVKASPGRSQREDGMLQGAARADSIAAITAQIHTVTSGLDSMQSIEEALDCLGK